MNQQSTEEVVSAMPSLDVQLAAFYEVVRGLEVEIALSLDIDEATAEQIADESLTRRRNNDNDMLDRYAAAVAR